jgi:DNA invertase Pin-like site-specific DNA recombinase
VTARRRLEELETVHAGASDETHVRALAHYRVSTEGQADSGLGLAAQRSAVKQALAVRGWSLVGEHEDLGLSGKAINTRPALLAALKTLDAGEADVLVVAKGDRLSRSVGDWAWLLKRAERGRWSVLAADLALDPGTLNGRLVQHVMAAVWEWERGAIGERTRAALAEARARGVRLGRPRALSDATVARIVAMREQGISTPAIARALTEDGTPTAKGGRWFPSTVRRALDSAARHPI